jgi:hypothetical protein
MQRLIQWLFSPVAFSVGFITPLIAQVCTSLDIQFGSVPPLAAAFLIAVSLGGLAQARGTWLWHRP